MIDKCKDQQALDDWISFIRTNVSRGDSYAWYIEKYAVLAIDRLTRGEAQGVYKFIMDQYGKFEAVKTFVKDHIDYDIEHTNKRGRTYFQDIKNNFNYYQIS